MAPHRAVRVLLLFCLLSTFVAGWGCKHRDKPMATAAEASGLEAAEGPQEVYPVQSTRGAGADPFETSRLPEPPRTEPTGAVPELMTVYFDFDSSELRDDTRRTLDDNLAWLKQNKNVAVQIEGHCDERGTNEYNLSLGQKRADSVRDYLLGRGVEPHRLTTISYGEERPVALGQDESAWRLNRRARFMAYQ